MIKNKKIQNYSKKNTGFTLIEIVVYLCLFAILFGGAIIAAYNLIEGNARAGTEVLMQNEGDFLIGKIDWALSQPNPPIIKLLGNNIIINESGSNQILNNTNVSISNLIFTQNTAPETNSIYTQFSFTMTSKTPNGMTLSQDFSGLKYDKP